MRMHLVVAACLVLTGDAVHLSAACEPPPPLCGAAARADLVFFGEALEQKMYPALLFPQAEPPRALPPSPLQLLVERTEVAEPLRPDEPGRELSVTLLNPGPKTVHGFVVRSMATSADGRTSYGGFGSDTYAYPVREDGLGGPIITGARRTVRTGPTVPGEPVSFGARVVAVIFEDDTAVGDEKELQYLFERRALDQRTWPLVERIIAEAMAAGGEPRTVLEKIVSAGQAILDDSVQMTDARAALRNLSNNLKHTRDPKLLLETFVADVHAKRRATEVHYRRR
jgi:hypothetical protein